MLLPRTSYIERSSRSPDRAASLGSINIQSPAYLRAFGSLTQLLDQRCRLLALLFPLGRVTAATSALGELIEQAQRLLFLRRLHGCVRAAQVERGVGVRILAHVLLGLLDRGELCRRVATQLRRVRLQDAQTVQGAVVLLARRHDREPRA